MVTVDSHQVIAGRDPVVHFLVPAVEVPGMFAGVRMITRHMTTTEGIPKKKERKGKLKTKHISC